MYAAIELLITTPQTISIALGAALITITGYRTLLLAMAVVIALAAAYLLSRPEQRRPVRPAGDQETGAGLPVDSVTSVVGTEPRDRSDERL